MFQEMVNEMCDTCPSALKKVQLKVKDQYGRQALYPHNEQAHLFAKVAGTKTLTVETIKHIMALGYTVEYIHEQVRV
jgi:hypothetical protein